MLRQKKSKKSIWKGLLFVIQSLIIAFPLAAQDFTIVVLPDTQHYSRFFPAIFTNQTQWIVSNKDALNIVYVAHEGDIVGIVYDTEEWNNADAAMSLLENPITTGLPDGIPYGVVPGNHDEPTINYNIYFGVSRFSNRAYYGDGHPSGLNDNNYTFFSASGMDFIVINLEYVSPPADLLDWADNLLKIYSFRRAIVVSHYILNTDGSFGLWGQQVYDALKDNPNLFLMLCGHQHGEAIRMEEYNGNTVHILLANYQGLPDKSNGYLRIMGFSPNKNEITVTTYSPFLNQYGADTAMGENTTSEEFTISYNMNVVTALEGTVWFSGTPCAPGIPSQVPPCNGPYPNYEIIVYKNDGVTIESQAYSDENGDYNISLSPGDYIIYTPSGPFGPNANTVTIAEGETTTLDLVVDTGFRTEGNSPGISDAGIGITTSPIKNTFNLKKSPESQKPFSRLEQNR